MQARGNFSSRWGFILAAVGSAVGLGNIWAFPTNTAQSGGAAFLLVYLVLAFCLAYPVLLAELAIGRHAQANPITALRSVARRSSTRALGRVVGTAGAVCGSLILSFYAIVAGWMMQYGASATFELFGLSGIAGRITERTIVSDITFTGMFLVLSIAIVANGVQGGIEYWSRRLMPIMIVTLFFLVVYVLFQPGALAGLKYYLVPTLQAWQRPTLFIDAMGQAFFSLSLGVGTMLVYGSYVDKSESLPRLAVWVTMFDIGLAFVAGLLIIPAMYAAKAAGAEIFTPTGELIAGPALILQVLPHLFTSMGAAGNLVATLFFFLMTVAALTSAISMLEVPVATTVEEFGLDRRRAAPLLGAAVGCASLVLIFYFDALFDLAVSIATEYGQPLLSIFFCVFVGWIWRRQQLLAEFQLAKEDAKHPLLLRAWAVYVQLVCPFLILAIMLQTWLKW